MLVIDRPTAQAALSISDAIPIAASALRAYSAGDVDQPLRTIIRPDGIDDLMGVMPCYVGGEASLGFGLKAMVLKPANPARGLDLHVGVVIVFDPDTGLPLALIDAGAITAVRTPAVTAVATDLLARKNAGDLAILGSGVQGRGHLEAMLAVRAVRRVRVWSRTPMHSERFRAWAWSHLGVEVEVHPTARAALEGADLVCTTLASKEPVVSDEDVAPGAHLNAIGASFADHRELASAFVRRCSVFVDSRASARAESGDLIVPEEEGLIGPDHVLAEIGEVLLGRHPGRRRSDESTLFKSLGLAVEDVTVGFAIAQAARDKGLGTVIKFH
ncbi:MULTISPECIES: ornithine cyclodeaminase family protein [unclassified Frankia]|uniref:ornithine cyclodeaminase family protein n=1 Tax=unclassified Frankia TaxID=2632575 RepID=UPI001EF4144B|nr:MULTISPECIES: ornithine cyclodeaminase family protein [unclassified Frankia]